MYIHEALREALKRPSVIRRSDFGRSFILVPEHPRDVLYGGMEGSMHLAIGWEPSADDLMADDWEVAQVEGVEWPESVPNPILRTWQHYLQDLHD